MSKKLENKVSIITGAGGSIGQAAAILFAREGAIVVGSGSQTGSCDETLRTVRAGGGQMEVVEPLDLTSVANSQALVDFTIAKYGRIDVLFNNAARAHFNWIDDISDEEWDLNRREEVVSCSI